MIIGLRQRLSNIETDPTIELGENKIKRVKHSKTLGIIIDDQLLWKKQVETTVSKVSKGIGVLRRIKSCVPKRTLIKVYNAIILPHFHYCIALFGVTAANTYLIHCKKCKTGQQQGSLLADHTISQQKKYLGN